MSLTVAGLQMAVRNDDVSANEARIAQAIDAAAQAGAEILLTPEGSLSGYHAGFNDAEVVAALWRTVARAKAARLGLALGSCYRESDGRCYNELRFYGRDGAFPGFHAKILLCSYVTQPSERDEIRHYASRDLRTVAWSPSLTVGGLICNDMWANPEYTDMADPHLARQLGLRGARVIFHAVNGGRDGSELSRVNWQYHESNLRLRARAAGAWIVTVDNAQPHTLDCSSPSGVLAPDGTWACRGPARGDHLFVHTLPVG